MPSSIAVECLTKPDLGLMLLKQIIEIIWYPVVESAKFHNKEGKKKKVLCGSFDGLEIKCGI